MGAVAEADVPPGRPRARAEDHDLPVTVVAPSKGWHIVDFSELWAYRELLYFLTWRDVKVRYKQTVLGAAWAVIQPFVMMVVFTVVFGNLAGVSSHGVPYPIFAFAALVPWTLFAQSLGASSGSLVGSANLISKVYFPRLIAPLAAAGSHLIDFIVAFALLLAMMVYYGIGPTVAVVWLPAFTLLAVTAAFSIGIWLSALNVKYRDVQHAVPFLIQLMLFASPIGYSAAEFSGVWSVVYSLNPMAGVAEGFRWALLGTDTRPGPTIAISTVATVALLLGGLFYFRRVERTFADVI